MGFRFRKSIKIAKGVRLNLGSKSAGISIGGKGAKVGFNTKKGAYISGGIPGTGLYAIEYVGNGKGKNSKRDSDYNSPSENYDSMTLPKELEASKGLGCIWSIVSFILILSAPPLGILSIIGQFVSMYLNSKSIRSKARTIFLSGKHFYDCQNYSVALEKFGEVQVLYPNLNSLHLILSEIHIKKKNLKEAIFHYKEYLKQDDDIEIKFKLGNIYSLNNQIQEAVNIFQSFPFPYKEDLKVICSLSACFIELNKYDAALEVLLTGPTRKRNMDDEIQIFRYLLGLCYQELGDKKKAISQFNKVYAYNANYKDIADRLKEMEAK